MLEETEKVPTLVIFFGLLKKTTIGNAFFAIELFAKR